MNFSVLIKTESRYPVNRRRIKETVKKFLTKSGLVGAEVSLAFVGKRKLSQLAKKYLKKDQEHVILTFPFQPTSGRTVFPSPESRLILGDIVISYPEIINLAKAENKRVDNIIDHLVIYGLGHLLGQNPKWP